MFSLNLDQFLGIAAFQTGRASATRATYASLIGSHVRFFPISRHGRMQWAAHGERGREAFFACAHRIFDDVSHKRAPGFRRMFAFMLSFVPSLGL